MTIEQTKEAIRIMQAFVDGKEIEMYSPTYLMWKAVPSPFWDFSNFNYRIKPVAKIRPWRTDEVPIGAILRYKGNNHSTRTLIVCNQEKGLCGYNTHFAYDYLRDYMEHSTDGGKTWHPCGVMEETK